MPPRRSSATARVTAAAARAVAAAAARAAGATAAAATPMTAAAKCSNMVELPHEDCQLGCRLCYGLEGTKEDDDKLALICGRIFHEESDEVGKYVGGLPDMIWGN
ncbi:hypothetical protein Tco_0181741, partial [Tanacetum coccineum]